MLGLVFYSAADPAAGVIGQAFRVAGLHSRGETRAAVASAHHAWHERVSGVRVSGVSLTPAMVASVAVAEAQRRGVGELVRDSIGLVVGQALAEAALAEQGIPSASDEDSYVKWAVEQLWQAAKAGQEAFDRRLDKILAATPPGAAKAAIESIAENVSATWQTVAEEGGKTIRELKPVFEEGLKTAREGLKAPKYVSAAGVVMALATLSIAWMIYKRTA